MPEPSERRWRPRFSLRIFLLCYLTLGCGIAWFARCYSEYLAEQKQINVLAAKIPPGTAMTVATNGKTTLIAGSPFM